MKKQILFIIIAGWMMSGSAMAQTITPGFEMGELIRLGYSYRQPVNLNFDVKYQYADSSSPSVILEEINGQYKMHEGRYWAMIDSTEIVQGNNYNLTIFHEDKVISIHKPQYSDDKIFQLPVLDSLISSYTDSIRISQVCDSVNLMKIYFKNAVQFGGYEMLYNPKTYLVNSMQYYLKDTHDSTSSTKLIKVSMSHYCECAISEDYFLESKFIYKDSTFYTRPDYSDYELVVDGDF